MSSLTHGQTSVPEQPATGWGFALRHDGRVALTYAGHLVATAACRSTVDQTMLYSLYARLVSAHATCDGGVAP